MELIGYSRTTVIYGKNAKLYNFKCECGNIVEKIRSQGLHIIRCSVECSRRQLYNKTSTDTHRSCSRCKEIKPHSAFSKDKTNISGLCTTCKECASFLSRKYHKEYKAGTPEYVYSIKNRRLKKDYGITVEQYNEMLAIQNYKCKICDVDITEKPNLDHCHKTGKVRSMLCSNCNRGIGHLQDNPDFFCQYSYSIFLTYSSCMDVSTK